MVGWPGTPPARQEPSPPPKAERDTGYKIQFILDHAVPLAGSAAEAYLQQRGLVPPACVDLLFHPDLTHWESKSGYPALIGVVRDGAGEVARDPPDLSGGR